MNTGVVPGPAPRVVVRFLDGRVVKGTTRDFAPGKPLFHVIPLGDDHSAAVELTLESIKAVFFVKTFEGNPTHRESKSFDGAKGNGRRIVVTFVDGEILAGFTAGYTPNRPGFFLLPVDPECNNLRVFVVNAAVRKVEWLPMAQPAPAGAASG